MDKVENRPQSDDQNFAAAYREMAQDEEREAEALEWAEATVGDISGESR